MIPNLYLTDKMVDLITLGFPKARSNQEIEQEKGNDCQVATNCREVCCRCLDSYNSGKPWNLF